MRQHAVAAELRRPYLNRNPDSTETIGGKEHGERIGDDGGLDPRIVSHRLPREFLSANLLAEPGRGLLAKVGDAGPIRIGADHRKPGVAAPREPEDADAFSVDAGSKRRRADHEVDQAFDVVWPLDIDRKIVCPAQIQDVIAGMIDGCNKSTSVSLLPKEDIRSSTYVWFCLTTPSSSPSSVRHASSISGDHSAPRSSCIVSPITPKNFPNSSR